MPWPDGAEAACWAIGLVKAGDTQPGGWGGLRSRGDQSRHGGARRVYSCRRWRAAGSGCRQCVGPKGRLRAMFCLVNQATKAPMRRCCWPPHAQGPGAIRRFQPGPVIVGRECGARSKAVRHGRSTGATFLPTQARGAAWRQRRPRRSRNGSALGIGKGGQGQNMVRDWGFCCLQVEPALAWQLLLVCAAGGDRGNGVSVAAQISSLYCRKQQQGSAAVCGSARPRARRA
jgi:hypothetical protein